MPATNLLEIRPSRNNGATVTGWDRNSTEIRVCKCASASTREEAAALLQQIVVSIAAGRVEVKGAERGNWSAHLIVRMPRNGAVDIETTNGPLALSNLGGSINVRTSNGPVSLRDVPGTVQAAVSNGPISVSGDRGNYSLSARNGPISLRLNGSLWQGTVHAESVNGPLNVSMPDGYQSGVAIDTSRNAPISCRAVQCKDALGNVHSGRLEFGTAPFVVELRTVHGPVSVDSR